MKKTVKIILLLAIAVLAAGSCKKEIFSKKGEKISFGAGAASDATKLSYGSVDGSKNQAINWTVGDKIMIAGKNCPTTVEGASNPATYKVTEVTSGKENYGKIDVDGTGLGLVWGEPGTTHDFYAVYPASKTGASISVSTAGKITGCVIPAVQGYIGTPAAGTTSKGEDAIIVQPDMTNLYMVAKIENVESGSKVSQGGEEVFLDFKPLSTALEFTIENGFDGTDAMKVVSVSVGSEGEDPYILNGGFEVDMTEDGLYERPWTRHTESSPTASNSKVTINFSSPVEVAKDGKLNFTFFLNPGNYSGSTGVDVKDLYFEITFKDNRDATGAKTLTRKAVMKKKNGDAKEAISFPTHKKTHIYGLLVPEYITFDIEGDVVVVPWDESFEGNPQFIAEKKSFVLNVVSQAPTLPHTGGDVSFSVQSYSYVEEASKTAEPWILEYLDSDGNWQELTSSSAPGSMFDETHTFSKFSGTGVTSTTDKEDVAVKVKEGALSTRTITSEEHTKRLRNATQVGTMSNPYDLSLHTVVGDVRAANAPVTANCYVIAAPGWYCFPLVYGNSYSGSTTPNTAAYAPNATANKAAYLTPFRNAIGTINASCGGVIETDAGVTLSSASVQWEDRPDETTTTMVGDVSVIAAPSGSALTCKYMRFYIDPATIRQGNIILKVTDGTTTYWSWHIWVTDNPISTMPVRYGNNDATTINMMTFNLGWCDGDSSTLKEYAGGDLRVRVRQVSDRTPIVSDEFTISRRNYILSLESTDGGHPYYEWGRKDPMMPGVHVSSYTSKSYLGNYGKIDRSKTINVHNIAYSIQNPGTFIGDQTAGGGMWYYEGWGTTTTKAGYVNLWDASATSGTTDKETVKTIYDPCPPGFKVPRKNAYSYMSTSTKIGDFNAGYIFQKNSTDTEGIFFYASGYRNHENGGLGSMGAYGHYWTTGSTGTGGNGYLLRFSLEKGIQNNNNEQQCNGYAVRPVAE